MNSPAFYGLESGFFYVISLTQSEGSFNMKTTTSVKTAPNRRDHLVDTAIDLFSEQGYASTSIKAIAQSAGVSQGLMYNYFSSKEALLRYIFREGIESLNQVLATPDLNQERPLHTYLYHIFAALKQERKFWRLFHSVRMQSGIQEILQQEIKELQYVVISRLQGLLAPYVPTDSLTEALLLFATIDGITAHYFLIDEYPLGDVVDSLVEIYEPPVE